MEVEATLPIKETPELAELVVPNGNATRPGHRWFKYKEAFSADLLPNLVERLRVPRRTELVFLDPFCGVGTSLLSAQFLATRGYLFRGIGIDCNPLSALISRTKLSWQAVNIADLRQMTAKFLRQHSADTDASLPVLSSISTGRCISRHLARQIVNARDHILSLRAGAERDVLLVGLASAIEPLSKIRRDGRALRIVEKGHRSFRRTLVSRLEAITSDISALQRTYPSPPSADVRLGDGRNPQSMGFQDQSVDFIVTSPPYPNNIDYNEVYKLELWLLGMASTPENFLELRRQTFRSHPTCSPPENEAAFNSAFRDLADGAHLAPLLKLITRRAAALDKEHRRGRSKVLMGYAFDTWRSLAAHFRLLRPKSTAVYVVGNSLHGGLEAPYVIPTDLLVARLAELVGFEVKELLVARPLQRRVVGNHFLRDSVVVLSKP